MIEMKTFTFSLLFAFLFAGSNLISQPRFMLSHETASPLYYNPGIVTMMGENRVSLIHRSQFLGNQGPTTQGLVIGGRLPNSGLSLGGYLNNDIAGHIQRMSFRVSASYNIVETKKHIMGLGIYMGLLNQSLKVGDFNVFDPLINSSENIPYTNLDAGMGFHYQYRWDERSQISFGVASVQLPQSFSEANLVGDPRHFNIPLQLLINLAATIPISDQIALEPQTLFRPLPGRYNLKGGVADVYLNLYFFNKGVRAGIGGRLDKTSALLARFSTDISPKITVSAFGELHSQWGASFEVGISYLLGTTPVTVDPPRVIPGGEAYWESRSALAARASKIAGGPSDLTISSTIGDDAVINYTFADEQSTYALNNDAAVNVVMDDIDKLLDDARSPVRKYRLSELKEIEISIYSPQSMGALEVLDGPVPYAGEWGNTLNINYNTSKEEEIKRGTITELEFLLLKIEAIKRAFMDRGLAPNFTCKVIEISQSKKISLKLTVEKDY
jgi:type IX secretion system PorP/SprF family membrane protein